MTRSRFATDVFLGIGDFKRDLGVDEIAQAARKATAQEEARTAFNNGRTSSAVMLGQAKIEAGKHTSRAQNPGFLQSALPGAIEGAIGFAAPFFSGGGGGFQNFDYGIGSDVSGFSATDRSIFGGSAADAATIAGGGSVYWET